MELINDHELSIVSSPQEYFWARERAQAEKLGLASINLDNPSFTQPVLHYARLYEPQVDEQQPEETQFEINLSQGQVAFGLALGVGSALLAGACAPATPEYSPVGFAPAPDSNGIAPTAAPSKENYQTSFAGQNTNQKPADTNAEVYGVSGRKLDILPGYDPVRHDIRQSNDTFEQEALTNNLLSQSIEEDGAIDITRPYSVVGEVSAQELKDRGQLNPTGMQMTYRSGARFENGKWVGGTLGHLFAKYAPQTTYTKDGKIDSFGLDEKYLLVEGYDNTSASYDGLAMIRLNVLDLLQGGNKMIKAFREKCRQIITKVPPQATPTPTEVPPTETPTATPTPTETPIPRIPVTPIPSTMDYCVSPGVYRRNVSPQEALDYAVSKGYAGSHDIFKPVEGYRVWGNIQAFLAEKCNVTSVPTATPEPTDEPDEPKKDNPPGEDHPNQPEQPEQPSQPSQPEVPATPVVTPAPVETATLMPSQTPVETPTINATGTPTPRVEPSPSAMATFVTATPRPNTPTPENTATLVATQTPVRTNTPVPTTAATATPKAVPAPTAMAPFVTAVPKPAATPRPNQQPTATLFN